MRQLMRQRKAEMSREQKIREAEELCEEVMATKRWQEARTVLLYWALNDELNVEPLIDDLQSRGGTVLLPTCVGDDLVLREYEGKEQMRTGDFGIAEPTGRIWGEEKYGEVDMVVVPGVAFDREGGRLGRGRGFYDRLLPKLAESWKMGVGWSIQLVEKVERDERDVLMDEVRIGKKGN